MTAEESGAALTLPGGSIATTRRVVRGTGSRLGAGRSRHRARLARCPTLDDFFRGDGGRRKR